MTQLSKTTRKRILRHARLSRRWRSEWVSPSSSRRKRNDLKRMLKGMESLPKVTHEWDCPELGVTIRITTVRTP